MKKKMIVLVFVALIGIAIAIVTLVINYFTTDNLTFSIGDAAKINIKSGLTGDEVNIADDDFIKGITEDINALRFEKTSATDGKVGYAYMLTWYDADNTQIACVTITDENGYQISHDGYYYKVGADLNIDIELIDEMLNIVLSSSPAP